MTAAHQPRPALEVVPDLQDTHEGLPGVDDWRSQTVIDQYGPEHQFVGSLMWLSAEQARPLLDLVPTTALWGPQARWAYELISRVIEAGTRPTPVTVLAAGRRHRAQGAINPDEPPSEGQHKQLALYLFDAYAQAIAPEAAIKTYAQEILDEAYRRAFDSCGIRMQQLAGCGADRDDLNKQFTAIRDELADLRRRAETAAKTDRNQP